jgi:hypothetical protein
LAITLMNLVMAVLLLKHVDAERRGLSADST